MKKLICLLILISSSGFSKSLKCKVDEPVQGGDEKIIPVTITEGYIVDLNVIKFKNYEFSVLWDKGDEYYPQASLTMSFGKFQSKMYDFTLNGHVGPINVLEYDGLRFQCWVDKQ